MTNRWQQPGTDLRGRTVAITGGARGIGRAMAESFLAAGAQVAIGDLDADLCHGTAQELSAPGRTILGLGLDVTDPASFTTFLDEAEERLGAIDVLVNNAGVMPTGVFGDEDPATTRLILDVNVEGVIHGSRLAAARFQARGRGHLVNIASLAGIESFAGLATYCGSKHFVVGFTGALQRELAADGVAVTVVLPGIVRTELSAGATMPRAVEQALAVMPEDVADAVVRAVARPRAQVTVPRRFGALLTVNSLLPHRARVALERRTGAGTAYTQADPAAREIYHRRLDGQNSGTGGSVT